jgi:predicted RecA/RadA family phage recombinase
MAALTQDRATKRLAEPSAIQQEVPVAAGEEIFAGSIVSVASGLASAAAASDAGDYALFATEYVDNSAGAAGDVSVRCERRGIYLYPHVTADLGRADVGALVYASDDQTVTKTVGTNTPVGRIFKLDEGQTEGSAQNVWVFIPGELQTALA